MGKAQGTLIVLKSNTETGSVLGGQANIDSENYWLNVKIVEVYID